MTESYVSEAEVEVAATPSRVWKALTDPDEVAQYFFGARVHSDWQPGSPITWTGEYEGRPFEDKGEIVDIDKGRALTVTHFSPLSGQPDEPQNYHTLTYELTEHRGATHVRLRQDNNSSQEEANRSTANWQTVLDGLKRTAEGS